MRKTLILIMVVFLALGCTRKNLDESNKTKAEGSKIEAVEKNSEDSSPVQKKNLERAKGADPDLDKGIEPAKTLPIPVVVEKEQANKDEGVMVLGKDVIYEDGKYVNIVTKLPVTGVLREYMLDSLYSDTKVLDGVKDGEFTSYYSDGSLEAKGQYREGEREGVFQYFGVNETLTGEYTYEKGYRNGPYKEFIYLDPIVIEGDYIDGLKDSNFTVHKK